MVELGERLSAIKDKRLQVIEELTACEYISNDDDNRLIIYPESPSRILAVINSPIAITLHQMFFNATTHGRVCENPSFLMEALGIEKKIVNNYTPKMLVEKHGDLIWYYISQTCALRQEEFQSLFNILDALGFWQDDVKEGSSMNRSYDANHAYFASVCDYFVTNDRNTRNKANVAYELYGYKTKAVSYKEFVELLYSI